MSCWLTAKTKIRAAITEQSADRLALTPGKEVLVLIKAPWITLGFTAENPHNALQGSVTHIQRGENNSEVLMKLQSSGNSVCDGTECRSR